MKSSLDFKTFRPNFVTFFVFSGATSSWIFNISASLMVAKREFKLPILFCLDHALFTWYEVNNAQLLRDSEPIRLLETPRSLNEYVLIRYEWVSGKLE